MRVCGNILGHRQGKRGLTHGGSSGDDDEVGILPAARHVVEFVIAGRDTRQSVGIGSGSLNDLQGLIDDRIDLGVVLLHVPL